MNQQQFQQFTDQVGTAWRGMAPNAGYYPIYHRNDGDAYFGYSHDQNSPNPSYNTHYHVYYSSDYNNYWYQIKCQERHGDIYNQTQIYTVLNGPFNVGRAPFAWAQFFANGLNACYQNHLLLGGKKGSASKRMTKKSMKTKRQNRKKLSMKKNRKRHRK
jgi:hypothetical protein